MPSHRLMVSYQHRLVQNHTINTLTASKTQFELLHACKNKYKNNSGIIMLMEY